MTYFIANGWMLAKALAATLLVVAVPGYAQIGTVQVTGGAVSGAVEDGASVFKGIPFAAPPVGTLRWRAPERVMPWRGVRPATAYAPACVQDKSFTEQVMRTTIETSEDCLYLNVWTPAKSANEKLPVMVWIYGGGFAVGQTGMPLYDGAALAKRGVVLVSVAYRFGPLGFLAHPALSAEQGGHSGNYGLMDQIKGLKWVRDNIAGFGGDRNNITIFGESAGGISVSMLAASPLAKGLFHKAISESGGNFGPPRRTEAEGWISMRSLAAAEAQGKAYLDELGATELSVARTLDADTVTMPGGNMGDFWPNFDGYVLTGDQYVLYSAGRFNDTPVLIGTNSDEGSVFQPPVVVRDDFIRHIRTSFPEIADRVLRAYPHGNDGEARQAMADVFGDMAFAWPTWTWARLQSKNGRNPAYVYYFDRRTPTTPVGAHHADEMRFVFGNHVAPWAIPDKNDQALTQQFMGYWTNFARTGDPNGPGLPEWPKFSSERQKVMALGDDGGPIFHPHLDRLMIWEDFYAQRRAELESKE